MLKFQRFEDAKKVEFWSTFLKKNSCIISRYIVYYLRLLKAMKQEVAELSGNFCGELSPLDGGEGIRLV